MSLHDPYPPQDAVELAARIAPGAPVPWLRLELLALRERPELGDLLDPGRTVARATSGTTGCATLALGCVGVGGGLGGLYLAGRTTPRGFFETAPYSGVGALLVLVLLAVLLSLTVAAVRVWRRPWEGPPAGASGVLGLLAAIGGWIALLSRTPEARRWDAAYGWTWQVTTVACVGLGLALQVLAVRKLATLRPEPEPEPESDGDEVERRRRIEDVLATLPAWSAAGVRREIARAVDDLVARGVIGAADAERARTAPLGALARTMDGRAPA